MQWLGLGDRNSRFFHKVTHSRNIRNTIRRIVTGDGSSLTSQTDIKREATAHFESFLNGSTQAVPSVSHEELSQLVDYRCSTEEMVILQAPVQAEEIKAVLFSMPINKAPGPDGYPMEFYKAVWSVI